VKTFVAEHLQVGWVVEQIQICHAAAHQLLIILVNKAILYGGLLF
jgi:hypothetical protein